MLPFWYIEWEMPSTRNWRVFLDRKDKAFKSVRLVSVFFCNEKSSLCTELSSLNSVVQQSTRLFFNHQTIIDMISFRSFYIMQVEVKQHKSMLQLPFISRHLASAASLWWENSNWWSARMSKVETFVGMELTNDFWKQ